MNASQARDKLTEATRAVAAAAQDLADAREAVSFSEATELDVFKVGRALARAQEREAQARVDFDVAARRQLAEDAANQAEADRIGRALQKIVRDKRDAELQKYREFLEATQAAAAGFGLRLRDLSDQLHETGAGPIPSRWSSWRLLSEFTRDQLSHIPAVPGKEE